MKILVTGAAGQLGSELFLTLSDSHDVTPTDRSTISWDLQSQLIGLDITDPNSVKRLVRSNKPDVVINCAAFTDVDGAEINRDQALLINYVGVETLAKICAEYDCLLIHISTDHVFDGGKGSAYNEEDSTNALNYYGETKDLGEKAILRTSARYIIIRTSWLCGLGYRNIVSALTQRISEGKVVYGIIDEGACPTFTFNLIDAIERILNAIERGQLDDKFGVFHYCGANLFTAYELAQEIARITDNNPGEILPITSERYREVFGPIHRAKRPRNSALNCKKIKDLGLGITTPSFEDSFQQWQAKRTFDPSV